MGISDFVKKKRKEQGVSQEQLAQYAGVSFTLVNRVESGQLNLQLRPLNKILNVFGYEVGVVPQDRDKTPSEKS